MRFLHLSDLHIGKRVNEFSMLEDQRAILEQIIQIGEQKNIDCVLIAGDVYDKGIPPAEAVALLDWFLTSFSKKGISVFIIGGNHDSPERISFGNRIMEKSGIYIVGKFWEKIVKHSIKDHFGYVDIYMLPFLKPALAAPFFEEKIDTYEKAVKAAIGTIVPNQSNRSIFMSHQFVTNGAKHPERSDSEALLAGGVENVDYRLFDGFDYVALGHIHRPQKVGRETVRYAGSPLKYSFSEALHHKFALIVTMLEKGNITMESVPLTPVRDMRKLKGTLAQLTEPSVAALSNKEDYIQAILTDKETLLDPLGSLRMVYPNIMGLEFQNKSMDMQTDSKTAASLEAMKKTPLGLFEEFYENQNHIPLTKEQSNVFLDILEKLEEYTL